MGKQDPSDVDRLRELFEAFQRKRDLLQLLERCARAEGVRLFIGEESGFAALDNVQPDHRAATARRARAGRARRDRPHSHGLRAGDPGGAGHGGIISGALKRAQTPS